MRRGDFEALVRSHLDPLLEQRGFTLTPQPPPDWEDPHPMVVYEADPDDYARRYPSLRARFDGEVSCIDIWIKTDPSSGQLDCDLEGDDLAQLLHELGEARLEQLLLSSRLSKDLELQLNAIGHALARVLDVSEDRSTSPGEP